MGNAGLSLTVMKRPVMPKPVMQTQRTLSAVGLWWRWVLTTVVGVAIGSIFGIAACLAGIYYLSDRLIELSICHTGFGNLNCTVATGIVSGAIFVGGLVSFMQYLVLRRFIRAAGWWILSSTFAWTWIGFAATSLAYTPQFSFVMNIDGSFSESNIITRIPLLVINSLWLVLAGVLIGLLQWLVIWNGTRQNLDQKRSQHSPDKLSFRRSLWWIGINVVLVVFMTIAIMLVFRGKGSLYGILWFFLAFTPFYATITAATLVKMQIQRG